MTKSCFGHFEVDNLNNYRSSVELVPKDDFSSSGHLGGISNYYFLNNICDLDDKSVENVAEFIKYRFSNKKIYTWAGQTLLAVQSYEVNSKNKASIDDEPSIKAVVSRAWFKLYNRIGKINQSIVISGDSGAGKTYSGYEALKHLGSQQDICDLEILNNVVYKTWSSVPLLAAFGNAVTIHNNNSSRFGKLIQMQCQNGKIIGANIQTFLLERSRVSSPNKGESNFHIFSQILNDADEISLDEFHLNKTTAYKICPKSDRQQYSFSDTLEVLKFLQILEVDDMIRILSLILNLGNIDFDMKEDKMLICKECKHYIHICARIMQCTTTSLTQLLVRRLIAPKLRRGSLCYTSCTNIEECQERKNSLMRYLYDKLFNWLVLKINKQIRCEQKHDYLGILDIYGFEVFSHNTFEQICINYANERLQQYYVNDFYNKQMNYLNENCEKIVAKYDISNYNKRISLLDGSLSVFGILNEECLVNRYNTDIFIANRLSNELGKEEFFVGRPDSRSTKFSIRHYAGIVEYDCKSMVKKNRDKIPEEIITFLKETKFKFLSTIINSKNEGQIRSKTLLSKFKKSLDNLMLTLNEADVHYIKCLKSNNNQMPGQFDQLFFMNQLKYNGIMETLNLDFQNYSTVMSKTEFAQRFGLEVIGDFDNVLNGKIYVGKEKIYFKENSFSIILKYKSILMIASARKIQKFWKGYHRNRNKAAIKIQRSFRNYLLSRKLPLDDTIESAFDVVTVIENINFKSGDFSIKDTELGIKTKSRLIFKDDGIISRQRIAQVPVRFHISRTCIPFSQVLPIQEIPNGLCDIL